MMKTKSAFVTASALKGQSDVPVSEWVEYKDYGLVPIQTVTIPGRDGKAPRKGIKAVSMKLRGTKDGTRRILTVQETFNGNAKPGMNTLHFECATSQECKEASEGIEALTDALAEVLASKEFTATE